MKLPQRAEKCLKLIDEIEYTVEYYSGGHNFHKKDFQQLRDYITEISESKKLSNIKIATKIKKEMNEG